MDKKVLYRIYQAVLLISYIALMVFFVVKCLETGEKSSESSKTIVEASAQVVNTVKGEGTVSAEDPQFQISIRKIFGHYGYFALLGTVSILLYLSIKKIKDYILVILHFVVGFSFAFISEFILEASKEGRTASFLDVLIDFGGFITISTGIVILYYVRKHKLKDKICIDEC